MCISLPWKIEMGMACLRTILRDESQADGNSLLHSSSPTLNPTNQPNMYDEQFTFLDNLHVCSKSPKA